MANIITLFFSIILSFGSNTEQQIPKPSNDSVTTFYLIRHAEKDRTNSENHDPALTENGLMRAINWAKVLKEVEFDAIYSTNYKRTIQTAKPLADLNKLEILQYDPAKLYDSNFQKTTSGRTVLVVGHSNTTPQFVNKILNKKQYENIDDSENGALFIVQVLEDGTVLSQMIYIN
ncbi:phosphoglycerate mutase family protein [Gramella sp. MAR_2010_147]|uniref:SixA phosphatase family protein n=1 Tax=Gramella sp. MAR_2010_147 TaxID=1250205 RepID=UPI00087CF9F4|nr:phosphoglycerate mutase family protein [Gramella sp. MAR_2010_147]SDR66479.1 Histidine phosphatase superfamily (branch 1) [Gramella sp. MAR_2010_147]